MQKHNEIEDVLHQKLHVIEMQIDAVDAKRFRLAEERTALYHQHTAIAAMLQTIRAMKEAEPITPVEPTAPPCDDKK